MSRRVSTSSIAAKSSLPGTPLTLNRRYSLFLRQPVLHHHHRADVVGALDVAHVVALDAQRRLGQAEGSCSSFSARARLL